MRKQSGSWRNNGLARLHIEFAKMRRDLDGEELKAALHQYCAEVLNLSNVESCADLTDRELGWVLDAVSKERGVKEAAGVQIGTGNVVRGKFGAKRPFTAETQRSAEGAQRTAAEVTHLISDAQRITADKLFEFIGWEQEKREAWLRKRFKVPTVGQLTYRKAHGLIRVLFNVAVSRDIKRKVPGAVVTKGMVDAGIPDLKRRLGIQ